ncbi:MAG TPA: LacI family DNA-binding transcriptional regulator [Chloroflexota bacterium]
MANIHDVARQAGVSIATVSRVLNATATVNPEAAERVRAAAHALEYRPNHAAKALRANSTKIIGLLITDIQNPFFTALIRGVEDVTQREGYSLILCNSDENPRKERQYIEVLRAEQVAGAILVPTREDRRAAQLFRDHQIPVVAVDRRLDDQHTDAVLVDNARGAREAVEHLIGNGFRRIGVITGPQNTTTGRDRLLGYRQALQLAGIPHDPGIERIGSFKAESGMRLAEELLSLTPRIDALFVANNLLTLGALEALHARRLRIPEDIAVVGFDEMPWAALSAVSLTTVTQPVYDLGSTAAVRLFQRLRHPGDFSRQEIILAPTLSIRGSSRAVARVPGAAIPIGNPVSVPGPVAP